MASLPAPLPSQPVTSVALDEELQQLLSPERDHVHRARQVFVNRNLRVGRVDLIGFDMDYTLAIYQKRSIEQLSFDMTLARLVEQRGYPALIGQLKYDPTFVMRGLAVDRAEGNLLKMDCYCHVGRAFHGRRALTPDEKKKLYRGGKISFKGSRFAWMDTLFALPEACLYADIIELLEKSGEKVDYDKLYVDIRETIDRVHADNSLKTEVRKDVPRFVIRDPELGPALHKLRSGGKKLFLLTNSAWDYTDLLMSYLLDGCLPEYPSWRHYFDLIVCEACKPSFFTGTRPFKEINTTGEEVRDATSLERGRLSKQGNLTDFERMIGIGGDRILYVGDHIYGDIVKSKKTSLWRTCLIIEELEEEIAYTDQRARDLSRLAQVEDLRERLDDAVNQRKLTLSALEKRLERDALDPEAHARLEELRKREKADLEKLRRALKAASGEADQLEDEVEHGFNPFWGLLFKEGVEKSRFGELVEKYACIYTSRVSNLGLYSPMQYFRSARDFMPHERRTNGNGKPTSENKEGPVGG